MLPAILTAILFAGSGICGQRAAVGLGALKANALRLLLATLALGSLAYWTGPVDLTTCTAQRLFYSGVVGFGVGDVALFLAYPRLGARLTLLLYLCSAPLFGTIGDIWLVGTFLTLHQALMGGVILCGVAVALSAGLRLPPALRGAGHRSAVRWGVLLALLAGCGQGFGAALSRLAQAEAVREGLVITGIGQAFLRVLPGMGFAMLTWYFSMKLPNWLGGGKRADERKFIRGANKVMNRRVWLWLLAAASCGPIGGVSCFQWALGELRSGVVLSITATTPLLVMPLSYWLEQDRPGWRGVLGAIIAVAGVIGMVVAA
jgi:drug/metabolite transporter (DMT)-like permease